MQNPLLALRRLRRGERRSSCLQFSRAGLELARMRGRWANRGAVIIGTHSP